MRENRCLQTTSNRIIMVRTGGKKALRTINVNYHKIREKENKKIC